MNGPWDDLNKRRMAEERTLAGLARVRRAAGILLLALVIFAGVVTIGALSLKSALNAHETLTQAAALHGT